ncbi:MAG: lipocalin family protein [Phycisphaerales bacterium]
MRKHTTLLVSLLVTVGLAGCATSSVTGTWTGRGTSKDTPFNFGNVSFVGDGTFTAEAQYDGKSRVQSGTWSTKGNELDLRAADASRVYTFALKGNELTVTDPKSGRSLTLDRLKK